MSNVYSSDLHNLIKSLSKSEKRYFKRLSAIHSDDRDNGNVKLFDAMEGMKKYSEEKLLKKCPFIPPGLLSDYKNHLNTLVLKSLNHYHQEATVDQQIRTLIQSGTLLLSKGLRSNAGKILRKAERLASEYEKWPALLEVIALRKRSLFLFFDLRKSAGELKRLNQRKEEVMNALRNNAVYESLSEEAYSLLIEQQAARTPEVIRKIQLIRQHQHMREPQLAITLGSRYNRFKTLSLLSYLEADHESFYAHCREMLLLMEDTYLAKESPSGYMVAMQNFLIGAKNTRRYTEVQEYLLKLDAFGKKHPGLEAQIFAIGTDIRLTIFIDTHRYSSGMQHSHSILKELKKHEPKLSISHYSLFYFNLSYIALAAGDYKAALRTLNILLNDPRIRDSKPDIYTTGLLLELISLYESGKFNLLESRLQSAQRSMQNLGVLLETERVMLQFFESLLKDPGEKEEEKNLQALSEQLQRIQQDPVGQRSFDFFDFNTWCEARKMSITMEVLSASSEKTL